MITQEKIDKAVKKYVNSVFMKSIIAEYCLTDNDAKIIALGYLHSGEQVSIGDYARRIAATIKSPKEVVNNAFFQRS